MLDLARVLIPAAVILVLLLGLANALIYYGRLRARRRLRMRYRQSGSGSGAGSTEVVLPVLPHPAGEASRSSSASTQRELLDNASPV